MPAFLNLSSLLMRLVKIKLISMRLVLTIIKFQRGDIDMDQENTCFTSQDKYVTPHLSVVSKEN